MLKMLRLRPPNEHFFRFAAQANIISGVWAKFVGAVVVLCMIFGPIASLAAAAFIFTIFLPIGLLILWGRALEAELGWTNLDRWQR